MDRRVLAALCGPLRGHPVGAQTIAVSVQEEPETIEDVVEPYLIRLGMLARTPRGRVPTARAYQHLGLPVPAGTVGGDDSQPSLFT
jgi:holliday junction DNA helicase RuvB